MRRFLTTITLLMAAASVCSAGIVNYNGDIMPASSGLTQVIFGDTTMETDGNVLQMTTWPFEGVWFGATSGMALSGSGNYVSLDTRVSAGATDWYVYFGDGSNFAEFVISADSYRFQTATEVVNPIAMDLASNFHNFAIWMKNGIVTYAVDNSVVYSGAAVAYGGTPILVGDPSATTFGGTGSMYVDRLAIMNGVDFESAPAIPDAPEPSTWLPGAAGLAWLGCRRLRSR